ncbi:hypothetical protein ACMD2_15475 [Ananas comosus]|uniref:WEB family protein At1g65010, chloroplastic n=1 Tax=Ananas comosus TaxID=4615 RepID=A0A199W5L8_ANACO|nr:hypothetical protein ACMD2_15475 [Ananas comosus]
MLSSKSRSGSSEMAPKASPFGPNSKPPSPKSTKSTPFSSDSSDSRSAKLLERKSSAKATPSPEKRSTKVMEMQQQISQLRDELKREKEEKTLALEELTELKKRVSSSDRVRVLEKEVEKAKQSERKMLESLVSQTKQLEQTKISLEEAKLEIRNLEASASSASRSSRNLQTHLRNNGFSNAFAGEEEIKVLKNELKLATEAEEKSNKAMDDLAIALKEVTTEANQVKGKLSVKEMELENAKAEAKKLKASVEIMEEKLRLAREEAERLKLEADEAVAAWNERESGFIDCMKNSEDETNKLKQENMKLIESQRVVREENSKLRDILKQAVSEAAVVKEELEIARNENSHLKDILSEKENALQSIKQEYECIKVSEAAAQDSLKELKSMLDTTSTYSTKTPSSVDNGSTGQPNGSSTNVKSSEGTNGFQSNRWNGENSRVKKGRRHSIGEPAKFNGSMFDLEGSLEKSTDRKFASQSNVADMRAVTSMVVDEFEDEFDYIDRSHLDGTEYSAKQKKKKTILRKFGDIFRRKSLQRSNSTSFPSK